MKKSNWFVFLILSCLAVLPAGKTAFAFSAKFDQHVSIGEEEVAKFGVSVKDKKVRAESNFGNITALMIRNDKGAYSYIPAQKTATKIPSQLQQRNVTDDLPDFKGFLESSNGKKVGTETFAGDPCDIYEFKDPVNKENSKAWLSQTKNFPLKIEIKTPQGVTKIEFKNIEVGITLDDSLFEIPADVKIIDLGAPGTKPPVVEDSVPQEMPKKEAAGQKK